MTNETSIPVKSEQEKISISGFLLRVLWLAIVLVEIYFLIYDISVLQVPLKIKESSSGENFVAELISKQNTVRVQDVGELIWQETEPNQRFFSKQSLQQ